MTFLTLESEQGQDLDGDGQQTHLVLQTFNVASARGTPAPARINDARGCALSPDASAVAELPRSPHRPSSRWAQ